MSELELQLYPPAPSHPATRESSLRELRGLIYDFKYRDPEARRVVLEICERMRGLAAGSFSRSDAYQFDFGSPRADAIGDELLLAARAGNLVVRRRQTRAVVVPLDAPSEEVLGPGSSGDRSPDSKRWIGLTLVDQTGTPVPNRPYRVVLPDGTTIDGTLDSHGAAMLREIVPGSCQIWCPYVEPQPETTYTVQAGDHISGIAESFGFDDYTTVWNHPGNADLGQERPDPHVLQPGDTLTIPEVKAQAAANMPTSARHPFKIQRSPLQLRLTLLDLAVKPMASVQITVAGTSLTSDENGLVQGPIDKSAKEVILQEPTGDPLDLALGGLNPSDDTSDAGYKGRLYNLGFLWDPTVADTDDEMIIALQDFQAQYSLTVSGQLDDATKSQLTQVYGS